MPSAFHPTAADVHAGDGTARPLLEDGALVLRVARDAWADVEPWIPRVPPAEPEPARVRALIDVRRGPPAFSPPPRPPFVQLLSVGGWAEPAGRLLLSTPGGHLSAVVDAGARTASVRLAPAHALPEGFAVEISAGLTLAAACLLGRLERTLVHAAAIVAPDGTAWLLPAGTFSGKTTTCVNLIRLGWDYLSDDHVVLSRGADGIAVEGWPRRFNLDSGYERGLSEGLRARVEPEAFGPGRWRRTARLGGLLFPRVRPERPTALAPAGAADALAGLLQQSPWLMADPPAASAVLALLQEAARAPSFRLELGFDTYRDGARLANVLSAAVGRA